MDDKQRAALVALAIFGAGAWWYTRAQQGADATGTEAPVLGEDALDPLWVPWSLEPIISAVQSTVDRVAMAVSPGAWTPPAAAAPYLSAVYAAEDANGIPRNLLARLIYQESRYRPDIINGGPNSAGAVGIAQIIPRWHPTVDPRDPFASIAYAGQFLAQLKAQFGSWSLALAAYNWGPGNLAQKGFASAPTETRDYVAQITGAVGVA